MSIMQKPIFRMMVFSRRAKLSRHAPGCPTETEHNA